MFTRPNLLIEALLRNNNDSAFARAMTVHTRDGQKSDFGLCRLTRPGECANVSSPGRRLPILNVHPPMYESSSPSLTDVLEVIQT